MKDPLNPPAKIRKPLAAFIPKLIIGSAVFWAPILVFLLLANQIRKGIALPGDTAILQMIRSASSAQFDPIVILITDLGGSTFVTIAVTIACVALYIQGRRYDSLFLLFSVAGTVIINLIIKLLFQRSRPDLWESIVIEHSYSFPSGHAMISSALAFSVILIFWHGRFRLATIVISIIYFLSVSLSRLYLGVHYPSDIIAGWCISILWVASLYYIFQRFGRFKRPRGQRVI